MVKCGQALRTAGRAESGEIEDMTDMTSEDGALTIYDHKSLMRHPFFQILPAFQNFTISFHKRFIKDP